MKKKISILLILVLVLSMFMYGCDKEKEAEETYISLPYSEFDLTEYVSLPDYYSYDKTLTVAEVTDEELAEILLSKIAEYTEKVRITEGDVNEGDTITISFSGQLEDGTKPEGMNSDGYEFILGQGNFIDGFQESIYGHKVGDTFVAEVTFPDPYTLNEELSGVKAEFEITVVSKTVDKTYELTEEFVTSKTKYESVEEYREAIRDEEYEDRTAEAEDALKASFVSQILEDATVTKTIAEKEQMYVDILDKLSQVYATLYNMEWDDFRDEQLQMTQEEYEQMAKESAETATKQDIIMYAVAQVEDIKITESEFNELRDYLIEYMGCTDEEDFADYYGGLTIDEYMTYVGLLKGFVANKIAEMIYTAK